MLMKWITLGITSLTVTWQNQTMLLSFPVIACAYRRRVSTDLITCCATSLLRRCHLRVPFHFGPPYFSHSSSQYSQVDLSITGKSLFFTMQRFGDGRAVNKNKAMIEYLEKYGIVSSKKVVQVMEAVDRSLFVPHGCPPYDDAPMSIGYGATISAPHMHATCLQLLEDYLRPGMRALDVGSGTGYLTACFALMVGEQGRAVGVEHIPQLVTSSLRNLEKSPAAPLLEKGSLSVHIGDGRMGWAESGPYDAIHVGAAAAEIPRELIEQLKPGGRMVIPVGKVFQDLMVVDKEDDGSAKARTETSVRYVPLTSREAQIRGQ